VLILASKVEHEGDTDVDLDFYGPDESEYPQACENCRDEREIDRDAEYEASRLTRGADCATQ